MNNITKVKAHIYNETIQEYVQSINKKLSYRLQTGRQ